LVGLNGTREVLFGLENFPGCCITLSLFEQRDGSAPLFVAMMCS
jgi:hypothetical protein